MALVVLGVWILLRVPSPDRPVLPFATDRRCALSITDDTDYFQFRTTKPVYDLLNRFGARVTKTVWVFDDEENGPEKVGLALTNRTYRGWVLEQRRYGHEITLHSASAGDDERERTLAAYDSLASLIGTRPRLDIFHSNNKEAFYWGRDRLPNPVLRALYGWRMKTRFEGADPESPYYWVDRSRELIDYVRTYTFNELDSWAVNPSLPYEDPDTPDAPLWFASSNGRWGEDFVRLCRAPAIERLKRDLGVSIIYVHFAARFDTREVMETLARLAGDPEVEFVPAGEMLDRLRLVQLVRAGVDSGTSRWVLPTRLRAELGNLSVRPGELDAYDLGDGEAPDRMSLEEWAARAGVVFEWQDTSVLDGATQISRIEKWRLVGHWLMTQLQSPT